MKKYLIFALLLVCLSALLVGCGCEHEWTDATCTAPKTCSLCNKTEGKPAEHAAGDWAVTVEPIAGQDGKKEQLCADCGAALASEVYTLDTAHDGSAFTLNVEQFAARINNILQTIRPELSCQLDLNGKNELIIHTYWEDAYLTSITPQSADEKGFPEGSATVYPARMQILFAVNTTQQTGGENPVPVFDLQFETVQAMVMACDPTISAEDAMALVMSWLESGVQYDFITRDTLEYYYFISNLGQTLFTMAISPAE